MGYDSWKTTTPWDKEDILNSPEGYCSCCGDHCEYAIESDFLDELLTIMPSFEHARLKALHREIFFCGDSCRDNWQEDPENIWTYRDELILE